MSAEIFINEIGTNDYVVYLKGKVGLDHDNLEQIQSKLMGLIKEGVRIALDFDEVSYINSFAIRMIVKIYKQILAQSGSLEIVNISEQIYELFSMLGLDTAINITKKS